MKNFFKAVIDNDMVRNGEVWVSLIYIFIKLYLKESFLVLKNVKRDAVRYHLSPRSIVYNAVIKYPLLGFLPTEFFMYKLYENSYKDYLSFFSFFKILKVNKATPFLLEDKLQFKLHIKDKVKTSDLVAFYDHRSKKLTHYANPKTQNVVIKPYRGSAGRGVRVVPSDAYAVTLAGYSTDCIVEEFITQHHLLNDIFSGSVNTLRILTLRKDAEIIVVKVILKVGRSVTRNLDHMARGGICIDVDMESGTLLKGLSNYKYGHVEYTCHPETQYEFSHKTLPFFVEAMELAKQTHELFPLHKVIGWDIAITETGPCVVEGNRIPDLFLQQIYKPLRSELSATLDAPV